MPRLNQNQRLREIGMLESGLRHNDVVAWLVVTRVTITRLQRRCGWHGSTNDLPRSGRSRVTTAVQDRHIRTSHLRDRFLTATSTAAVTPGCINNRKTSHRMYETDSLSVESELGADTVVQCWRDVIGTSDFSGYTSTPPVESKPIEWGPV